MLRLAVKHGVKRVIIVSSAGIWTPTGEVQATEETVLQEKQTTRYTHSKYLAYLKTLEFMLRGTPVTVVLPVGLFGSESPLFVPLIRLLKLFRMAVVPECSARMCLISVDECVDGIIRAFELGKAGESYILSGRALLMGEIVERCRPSGLWFGTVKLPLALFRLLIRVLDMVGQLSRHVFYYNSEFLAFCTGGVFLDGSKAERELGFRQENFDEKFNAMVRGKQ